MWMKNTYVNQHDSDGACSDRGFGAEGKFFDLARSRGWDVRKASREDDIFKHIDCTLSKEGESTHNIEGEKIKREYSFQIKARKKMARKDSSVQDEWLWVEFTNVRGNKGWLYGEYDYIAFEMGDGFLIVKKHILQWAAENKVDMNKRVQRASDAKYAIYGRAGRKDTISMIKFKDILEYPHSDGEIVTFWKFKQ